MEDVQLGDPSPSRVEWVPQPKPGKDDIVTPPPSTSHPNACRLQREEVTSQGRPTDTPFIR